MTRRNRRPPFGLDEHSRTGTELHAIRQRLLQLAVEISLAYGKTSRSARQAERAWRGVDSLRAALDTQLARDLPAAFNGRVYYPGQPAQLSRVDEEVLNRIDRQRLLAAGDPDRIENEDMPPAWMRLNDSGAEGRDLP